eukprot:1053457-Alexandrium_andersonii.AAC.1
MSAGATPTAHYHARCVFAPRPRLITTPAPYDHARGLLSRPRPVIPTAWPELQRGKHRKVALFNGRGYAKAPKPPRGKYFLH